MWVSKGVWSLEHWVCQARRSFWRTGKAMRRLGGGAAARGCVSPRSEERYRERWIRWWSEKPEVLRVVVAVCDWAQW